jgi:hypothetical protein
MVHPFGAHHLPQLAFDLGKEFRPILPAPPPPADLTAHGLIKVQPGLPFLEEVRVTDRAHLV